MVGNHGTWKSGLGFQLLSLRGAQQRRMNRCLLTIYSLVFSRTQQSAKLILSAEKPNCTPRGYGSINDFTCLPVLFPLHTQSNPAPNCSVVSSAELIWEERMLSYVEGPTLEIESTHGVGQHKLIYPFEINTLILINFPKDLFADKLLSPVLMLSRWQAGKHLREDVNN